MIDLHTHILPGIDDGPRSVEEAMKMIEVFLDQNVKVVVCTPHFNPTMIALDDFLSKRTTAMKQLGSSKITLVSGSEVALNEFLFHYSDLSPLCIGDTNYILIELPFDKKWDEKLYKQLDRIVRYYNLIPVIAHIERYPAVKKSKKILRRLIEIGCLLQMNAEAILNKKHRRLGEFYIKHGFIDVIASDCHNMKLRPPNLAAAHAIIVQRLGLAHLDKLISNSERILNGQRIREKLKYIIIEPNVSR